MRRRTKWLIAGAVTVALAGGLWLSAPAIIKWKIHDRYPDVTVGEVEIGWKILRLKNITLDRKWLKGTFPAATVTWDEDVDIDGGHLDVNLDDKPSGATSSGGGHSIVFKNVTVHVTKGQGTADLAGVASKGRTTVCWTGGTATHPRVSASFLTGCAERDGSQANLDDVTIKALDIPHVPVGTSLGLHAVAYKDHVLTAGTVNGSLELAAKQIAKFDAAKLSIELPTTGDSKLPTSVEVDRITVDHPWISPDPVTFNHAKAIPDGGGWWHVTINGATFDVNPEGLAARGQPEGAAAGQSCQTWIDALPDELRIEPLKSLKFSGNFYWRVNLKATDEQGKPKPQLDFSSCKIERAACGPVQKLKKPFDYWVYSPLGDLIGRRTGPGTSGWTVIGATGPMPTAVINSEDYGFRGHAGFIPAAYYQALEADLKAGAFVRGGSTITMQLAKNLWLQRSKTLGRKIQELFLAMALESCLTKDDIMELYLNVIEFGPMVYGISEGAHYWFRKEPSELAPVEAFWLAGILTNPRKATRPTPDALARTSAFMRKLQTMGRNVGDLGPEPIDPPTP